MKHFLYILCAVFLVSCTSNTIYDKPKNLIPKDSMVNLLTDMYIASAAKNVKNKNLQKKVNYMPLVYEQYKIDTLRFQESNVYYSSVVEQYNEILLKVKNNLELKQKFYTDSLKVKDSIKREKNKLVKEKRRKQKEELKFDAVKTKKINKNSPLKSKKRLNQSK